MGLPIGRTQGVSYLIYFQYITGNATIVTARMRAKPLRTIEILYGTQLRKVARAAVTGSTEAEEPEGGAVSHPAIILQLFRAKIYFCK
jgi:hypothetical protein